MNLFELFKPAKNIIMEGIDHPEDLIISQGSAGADRVLADLSSLQKDPSTISVKWDGFPAVVFGRDSTGKLVFMDKHMYDKVVKGAMEFMSIKDYDISREANRGNLWETESALRPTLDKIIPNVKDQYWMGDLMWTGTPKTSDGYFVFKPNTVEYRVKIDDTPGRGNTLSDQIARSIGGIAVHTFIPGLGQSDQPLIGLKGLRENEGIVFLVGEMKDKPKVGINSALLNQTKAIISQHRTAVDKFISDLTAMKGKSVITAMGPFITRMLEEDDISGNIVPRFLEFLKERLNDTAQNKFLGTKQDGWLYQEQGGGPGLLGIWTMWAAITELKTHIKQQIDTQQQGSEIIAITDGVNAHEGYVFGSGKDKLKLIDRLGFSRANFAKHRVPDEEIEAKSKMPLAVFCFGRMNPPTMGHGLVINKTLELGGDQAFVFLSNSVGQDDPLDPNVKAQFVSQIYPNSADHIVQDFVQNPIYAANWLYSKGYRNMIFVAGSDRLGKEKGSIEKILSSWNSGPIRSTDPAGAREHVVIKFESAGQRDPDSEGVTGFSGTKARKAATDGDEQKFQQYTGVGPDIVVNGKTLYQATREGLGIKDEKPTAQTAPVKQQPPQAPQQQNVQVTKKVPGKAPISKEVDSMNESKLRDKEDLTAKRKALQDIQMDKHTHKDPELKAELARRKASLEKEAKKMNLSESIVHAYGVFEEQQSFLDKLKSAFQSQSPVNDKVKYGDTAYPKSPLQPVRDKFQSGTLDVNPNSTIGRLNQRNAAIKAAGDETNEARANTASARAGLAKRKENKPLSPEEQIAKDKAKSDKWLEKERAKAAKKTISESPIEMDPKNPNDPMVMPPGLNPGKLSYRKARAAAQLADLARMAAEANEKNSAIMWDSIVRHFPELETNIRSIQHGQDELQKVRRKGGVRSRGIDPI